MVHHAGRVDFGPLFGPCAPRRVPLQRSSTRCPRSSRSSGAGRGTCSSTRPGAAPPRRRGRGARRRGFRSLLDSRTSRSPIGAVSGCRVPPVTTAWRIAGSAGDCTRTGLARKGPSLEQGTLARLGTTLHVACVAVSPRCVNWHRPGSRREGPREARRRIRRGGLGGERADPARTARSGARARRRAGTARRR